MTEASYLIRCPYSLTVRSLAEETKKREECWEETTYLTIAPRAPSLPLINLLTSRKPLRRGERDTYIAR